MSIQNKLRNQRWAIKRWWWRINGVPVGSNASMFSDFGDGRFVSVHQRHGGVIDITSHEDYPNARRGMVRLIPYQPNHGVMVERWEDGVLKWRTSMSYRDFVVSYAGEESH